MKSKIVGAAALVLLTLVLAGCSDTVKISNLVGDPSRWLNKTVRVTGTVHNSMGAVGRGAYLVDDGTGTIWVISKTGVPARGARVGVEGEVFEGVQIFGQSFGVHIREKRHRTQ